MNKSKLNTIIIIISLVLYYIFSQLYLIKLGTIYTNVINPIVWVTIAILLRFLVVTPRVRNTFKPTIIKYVIITILLYILIYFLSGVLTGFGKTPYLQTIGSLINNFYTIGLVLLCKEYIRYRLINNVSRREKNVIFILIVIAFSLLEIKMTDFVFNENGYFMGKNIFSLFIPVIIKNILFTYLSEYTDYVPSFIYAISMYLMLWIPPILPNSPWVLTAMLDIIFPTVLFLYCRYYIYKLDKFHLEKVEPFNPKGMIPLSICMILMVWFAIGIFPIVPIGVATGSMKPSINVGDLVLVDKKVSVNDIKEGDVIQYQLDNYTVIHRVVKKYTEKGYFCFVTKGDNNQDVDFKVVQTSQLKGKVIFKIPYIALPTIWLNSLSGRQSDVEVETGG